MAVARAPRRTFFAEQTTWLVDRAAGSHLRAGILLVAVALLAFLPGFLNIPPVDRDEARFAQATKQMLESGDYVDIRFQDESRYKKPVGVYWLQAATVGMAEAAGIPNARIRIFLYRLPSLAGAVGAVLLTYWAALGFVSRRAAVLAGIMMATSILLGVEARLAKTDAMLLLTVVAAMGAFGRAYLNEHGARHDDGHPWINPAIFWTAIAGGILLKGPLILLFVGLTGATLVALDRSARWLWRLKPAAGIVWTLLLVLPWFAAIVMRSGESFFIDSIGKDLLAKVGSGQESHGLPPGFYTVLFWVTFFPGSMLAAMAAPAVWRSRTEPGAKFLLAWVVPAWILFELVPTKLPHYVLPLYPAIAILIAGIVDNHALSRARWLERGTVWWFIISIFAAAAIVVLHVYFGQGPGFAAWPFAAGAIIAALFAWWLYTVDGAEISLLRAAAASILISVAFYGATFPLTRKLFPAVELGNFVRPGRACLNPAVVTAGYHEPSLVFLTGTGLKHSDGANAAEFLKGGPCRFALIEARQDRSFVTRADAIGLRYTKGARIDGVNISGGRTISVTIYRSEGQ